MRFFTVKPLSITNFQVSNILKAIVRFMTKHQNLHVNSIEKSKQHVNIIIKLGFFFLMYEFSIYFQGKYTKTTYENTLRIT